MMNARQIAVHKPVPNPGLMSQWLNTPSGQIKVGHGFSATSERQLATHEHVFLDGEPQTHVYQVLEGVVGIYKLLADGRRQIVTFCYPGDMFGMDRSGSFTNHAEALCNARVRCIPQNAIDTLMMTEPGFGKAMLQLLTTELADTRDQLMSLGRKSALEKLATFLQRISRRSEQAGRDAGVLHLPMTRCDIADYLGLTIETVSRNFTKLKVSRIIRLASNSEVQILDPQQLEMIAEGAESEH